MKKYVVEVRDLKHGCVLLDSYSFDTFIESIRCMNDLSDKIGSYSESGCLITHREKEVM